MVHLHDRRGMFYGSRLQHEQEMVKAEGAPKPRGIIYKKTARLVPKKDAVHFWIFVRHICVRAFAAGK